MKNRSLIQRIKDGYANPEGKAGRPHVAMIAYQLLTFASVIAFIVVSCTPTVTSTMKIVWEDAGPDSSASDATLGSGSGPDGGSEPDASRHSMRVSPGLGAVSADLTVSAFNADGGIVGTGKTDDTGIATIPIGDHTGITIYEIHGCDTGCTYYKESTGTTEPFTANDTLLGVVPSVVNGAWVSGTVLTTMAAAFAGVTEATLRLEGSEEEQKAAIAKGSEQVNALLGTTANPIDVTAGASYMTAATADAGADAGSLSGLLAEVDKALNATASGLSSLAAANLFASGAALPSSATGDAGLIGLDIILAINQGATNANIGAINIFVLPDGGLPPLLTDIFPAADAGDDGGLPSGGLIESHKKF